MKQLDHALQMLRDLPLPPPQIVDEVERWLPWKAGQTLKAHGIESLADLHRARASRRAPSARASCWSVRAA